MASWPFPEQVEQARLVVRFFWAKWCSVSDTDGQTAGKADGGFFPGSGVGLPAALELIAKQRGARVVQACETGRQLDVLGISVPMKIVALAVETC